MLTIEKVMLGNKASRLEGIKCVGPLKCLLVKLNCIGLEKNQNCFYAFSMGYNGNGGHE